MDFINSPLDVVRKLFETHERKYKEEIINYFKTSLENCAPELLVKIPSLNDVPLHNLKSQTLVKFRCMIQDMFDPEYYMEAFEVKDQQSGNSSMRCGMYRDVTDDVEIDLDSSKNITQDRLMYYCISIPGENDWVKQKFAEKNCSDAFTRSSVSSCTSTQKRTLIADEMDGGSTEQLPNGLEMETDEVGAGTSACRKRVKISETTEHGAISFPALLDLNLPIPDSTSVACIVKVYDHGDSYSLNDVVEFIGILSMEPLSTSTFTENVQRPNEVVQQEEELMALEDEMPQSLVPRLHVVKGLKLNHNNPLLSVESLSGNTHADVSKVLSECSEIRAHLHSILEQAFWGDALVADYVICHLLSTVYVRKDVVALGKFSLNVTNVVNVDGYTSFLYHLIEILTTKSHFLPLTITQLNQSNFTPTKDYAKNRLKNGLLQLTTHTHLVVDETALNPGQLDSKGVKNITALGNLLQWQKVEYDFNYHRLDFETNIPVLLLSEGKSLMATDCIIPIRTNSLVCGTKQIFSAIDNYLTPDLLSRIRSYLSILRLMDYNIPIDLQELVQNDFVEKRQENSANMKIDDFHSLIVLARLLALSHGQTSLTASIWEQAKQMEMDRKARMLSR